MVVALHEHMHYNPNPKLHVGLIQQNHPDDRGHATNHPDDRGHATKPNQTNSGPKSGPIPYQIPTTT